MATLYLPLRHNWEGKTSLEIRPSSVGDGGTFYIKEDAEMRGSIHENA